MQQGVQERGWIAVFSPVTRRRTLVLAVVVVVVVVVIVVGIELARRKMGKDLQVLP